MLREGSKSALKVQFWHCNKSHFANWHHNSWSSCMLLLNRTKEPQESQHISAPWQSVFMKTYMEHEQNKRDFISCGRHLTVIKLINPLVLKQRENVMYFTITTGRKLLTKGGCFQSIGGGGGGASHKWKEWECLQVVSLRGVNYISVVFLAIKLNGSYSYVCVRMVPLKGQKSFSHAQIGLL